MAKTRRDGHKPAADPGDGRADDGGAAVVCGVFDVPEGEVLGFHVLSLEGGMDENLRQMAHALNQEADYQHGLECMIGFLLAHLESLSGYQPKALQAAQLEEWRAQLQADPDTPVLWPFLRLEAQLAGRSGDSIGSPGMPKVLYRRFPRLEGSPPTKLAVVAPDGDAPPDKPPRGGH